MSRRGVGKKWRREGGNATRRGTESRMRLRFNICRRQKSDAEKKRELDGGNVAGRQEEAGAWGEVGCALVMAQVTFLE